MATKYQNDPVQFFTVYMHEAHSEMIAGNDWAPKTYEDRVQRIKLCSKTLGRFGKGPNANVLVDEFPNRVAALYGDYPNSVFIVNKNGKLAFKAAWMNVEKVDKALEELLGK